MSLDYHKDIARYCRLVTEQAASDLHVSAGSKPTVRADGQLVQLLNEPALTGQDVMGFIQATATPAQVARYMNEKELDFAFQVVGPTGEVVGDRFRCNIFFERGNPSLVMRRIPSRIPSLAELKVPEQLADFARRKQGFFLVVGPVGQGKSTTLASLVDIINTERAAHIVTIEDPIEYLHPAKQSLVDQREVGIDTKDFPTALQSAFRQDIDVLLVGEMRGPATMQAAVTAAETGHLVFSTLHTNNASQTIDRIIDTFPSGQQEQIRLQLSASLAGVFSQRLVPRVSGGMVPAYELLINTKAVANIIRERRTQEIDTLIETGTQEGTTDMNRTLAELVARGEITVENAYKYAFNPHALERLL
jgi:twitching motility protein PilT